MKIQIAHSIGMFCGRPSDNLTGMSEAPPSGRSWLSRENEISTNVLKMECYTGDYYEKLFLLLCHVMLWDKMRTICLLLISYPSPMEITINVSLYRPDSPEDKKLLKVKDTNYLFCKQEYIMYTSSCL